MHIDLSDRFASASAVTFEFYEPFTANNKPAFVQIWKSVVDEPRFASLTDSEVIKAKNELKPIVDTMSVKLPYK